MRILVERVPRRRGGPEPLQLDDKSTAIDAVRALGLHPDAVLVVRDGTAVPIDAPLVDGEEIRIVTVASGG